MGSVNISDEFSVCVCVMFLLASSAIRLCARAFPVSVCLGPSLRRPSHHNAFLHLRRYWNANVREDFSDQSGCGNQPEQPLSNVSTVPFGPVSIGHRRGLAGHHAELCQWLVGGGGSRVSM